MSDSKPQQEEHGRRPRRGLRGLRLWEKKRGSRQTGSTWLGGAGETIFYASLFFVGLIALTELISLRVIWNSNSFLTSNWGLALSILMLGSLIITGAVGAFSSVVTAGTSAERRAALAKRAVDNELIADVGNRPKDLPSIPDDANFRNSPGIQLAYRLPHATSPSWRLGVVASFCLAWNGAVAVLAVLAFNQRGEGFELASLISPSWWSLFRIVVLMYGIIGVLSIKYLVQLLVVAAAIGPTNVEVSHLPLYPGGEYRAFLSQSGHLQIDWLDMRLVCDEEVSFSDGTDTRSESRRVYDIPLFFHENFEILPSRPFQSECPVVVPENAMHSFVAANNSVTWKLVVKIQPKKQKTPPFGQSARWMRKLKARLKPFLRIDKRHLDTIHRVYPLIVHPSTQN